MAYFSNKCFVIKVSRKRNEKCSRFQINISVDSADLLYTANPQNWRKVEKFVLLADKRLDSFVSDLRLIFNLQNEQKIESGQLFTSKITASSRDTRIDRDQLALVLLHLRPSKKHFRRFRGFAQHCKSAESAER